MDNAAADICSRSKNIVHRSKVNEDKSQITAKKGRRFRPILNGCDKISSQPLQVPRRPLFVHEVRNGTKTGFCRYFILTRRAALQDLIE